MPCLACFRSISKQVGCQDAKDSIRVSGCIDNTMIKKEYRGLFGRRAFVRKTILGIAFDPRVPFLSDQRNICVIFDSG